MVIKARVYSIHGYKASASMPQWTKLTEEGKVQGEECFLIGLKKSNKPIFQLENTIDKF